MAISFIDATLSGTTDATTLTITTPATLAGDLLLLEYTHRDVGTGTIGGAGGTGWSTPRTMLYSADTFSVHLLWKAIAVDTGAEAITVTGLTNSCAGVITHYRGTRVIDDPIEAYLAESNASANETQAEITTLSAGAFVVLTVANSPDVAITSPACTSPGALTARAERLNTTGTDTSIAHASASKATAGATGAFTWAQTNGASGSMGYAIMPLRNEAIVTENLKVSGAGEVTLPLTAPLKVSDSVTAALAVAGDLTRAVTDESLKLTDGPVLAQETPLLATAGPENLKLTDGPVVAEETPLLATGGPENLKLTDGPVLAQETPLLGTATQENLTIAEGPAVGRLDPLIVAVTADALLLTDGPPVGRLDPIIVLVAGDALKLTDGPPIEELTPLLTTPPPEALAVTEAATGGLTPLFGLPATEHLKLSETATAEETPLLATGGPEQVKVDDQEPPLVDAIEGGALSRTVTAENLRLTDGPPLGGVTPLVVTVGAEALLLSDGPPEANKTPLFAGASAESLLLTDGPAVATVTLLALPTAEGLKLTDGPVLAQETPLLATADPEGVRLSESVAPSLTPLVATPAAETLRITFAVPAIEAFVTGAVLVATPTAENRRIADSAPITLLNPLRASPTETLRLSEVPLLLNAPGIRSSVTTGVSGGGSATPTINLPAVVFPGDTLIVVFRSAVGGAVGWPAGWVELFDVSADAADDQFACAWKKAIGTEDGTTIQLTSGAGNYAACAWSVYSVADPTVIPPELSLFSSIGTLTTQPDAPPISPNNETVATYLFMALCGMEGEATGPSLYPASYTMGNLTATSGTAGAATSNVIVSGAFRNARPALPENPAAWTFTGTLDDWTAYTIAFTTTEATSVTLAPPLLTETVKGDDIGQGVAQILTGTLHIDDSDLRVEIPTLIQVAITPAEGIRISDGPVLAIRTPLEALPASEVMKLHWDETSAVELSHEEGLRFDDTDLRVAFHSDPNMTLSIEAEALHLTDSLTASRGLTIVVTDEEARISDPALASRTLESGLLTDGLKGSESAAGILDLIVVVTPEGVKVADGPVLPLLDRLASASEALRLSDAVTAIRDHTVTLQDSLKVTDSATGLLGLIVASEEATAHWQDTAPQVAMGLIAALTESIRLSETSLRTLDPLQAAQTETLQLNDRDQLGTALVSAGEIVAFVQESLSISEVLSVSRDLSVTQTESVRLVETFDVGFGQPLVTVVTAEAVLLSETLTARRDLEVAVTDEALVLADSAPVAFIGLSATPTEALCLSDTGEAVLDLLVTLTESVVIATEADHGFGETLEAATADETCLLSDDAAGAVHEVIELDVTPTEEGLLVSDDLLITREDQTLAVEVDPEVQHVAREDLLYLSLELDVTPDPPPFNSIQIIKFTEDQFLAACDFTDEDLNVEMFTDESFEIH